MLLSLTTVIIIKDPVAKLVEFSFKFYVKLNSLTILKGSGVKDE